MRASTPVLHRLLPAPEGPVDPLEAYGGLAGPAGRPAVRVNMIASLDGAAVVDGVSGGLGGPPDRLVYLALRTLADVVASLGHAPEAVSTAVNGAFVARPARATQRLAEGDQVLLFQPIVGG